MILVTFHEEGSYGSIAEPHGTTRTATEALRDRAGSEAESSVTSSAFSSLVMDEKGRTGRT